jgi:hypothetical protein
MRFGLLLVAQILLFALPVTRALAADETMHVELNALDNSENRCRITFVIKNDGKAAVDSLKLELVLFNTEGAVYRRMLVELGPLRAAKTVAKTFATDGECAQLSALLVNEVSACQPGEPNACLDQLALSSRVKNVRLYK